MAPELPRGRPLKWLPIVRSIVPGTCVRVLGLNRGRAIRRTMEDQNIVTAQRRLITARGEKTSHYLVWHLGRPGARVPVCGACLSGGHRACQKGAKTGRSISSPLVRCECLHAVPVDVGIDRPRRQPALMEALGIPYDKPYQRP